MVKKQQRMLFSKEITAIKYPRRFPPELKAHDGKRLKA